MYKHIFLNPFYWFALIWGGILVLYPLGWAEKYPPLTVGIACLFIALILVALALGFLFSRYIKKIEIVYRRPRYPLLFAALISIGFIADFIWARQVPLFDILFRSDRTYLDFDTFPVLHMLVFTFAFFYAVYLFYCLLQERSRKHRLLYLFIILLCCFFYTCLYNRSVLMMLGFMFVAILLSSLKKIRVWHLAAAGVVAVVALYLFGILGNIRSGAADFKDTSYLIRVAGINMDRVPDILPRPFLWAYVYILTPFGNLVNYIRNFSIEFNLPGLLSCILPDTLSKRIFPSFDSTIPLVIPELNVSSGFAEMYKFGGYFGIIFGFAYMSLMIWVLTRLIVYKKQYFTPVVAILSCITAFLFFDNFLNYSGILLALVFPFIVLAADALIRIRRRGELPLTVLAVSGEPAATICDETPSAATTPIQGGALAHTPMKTCLVMLCTYNGEKYLRKQIDSVLAQTAVLTHIKVADDRSSDGTVAILEEYAAAYPDRFSFSVNEENKRFTYNFLDLFHSTGDTDYDYYAFCDQDDVWLPEKLSAAAAKIEEAGDLPHGTLYCSNLTVVNERLEKIGMQEEMEMIRRTSRMTVLFENIATGCTIVMDKKFHDYALTYYPKGIQLHDYWLFLIAVYTANAIYDPEAYILYRQHGGNQIGTNKRKWTLDNIKKFFHVKPKQEYLFRELLLGYGEFISEEDKEKMTLIRDYRHSGAAWLKLLFDPRYHKRNNNLILKLKLLCHKL